MILPAFLFSSDLLKEHAPGSLWPKKNEETHGAELPGDKPSQAH